MKKKTLPIVMAAICLLGGALVGCGGNQPSTTTTTKIVYTVAITNKTDLQKEWKVGEATRSLSLTITPTVNIMEALNNGDLVITSSAPSVISATGLSLSIKDGGTATITATYKGEFADSVTITATGITYTSIADVISAIKTAGTSPTSEYTIKGVCTNERGGSFWLQDDAGNAMYVYNGQNGVKKGDEVRITSTFCSYKGLYETKSISSVAVIASSKTVPDAKVYDKPSDMINDHDHCGVLASMEGLTYVSGEVVVGTSSSVIFKKGDTEITFHTDKYTADDIEQAIADKVNGKIGSTDTVDFIGMNYGWNDDNPKDPGVACCARFEISSPDQIVIHKGQVVPVETINVTDVSVEVGKGVAPTVEVLPTGASDRSYTLSITDTTIAKIEDGKVVGIKEGTTTVTATSVSTPSVSGSATVTVTPEVKKNYGTKDSPASVADGLRIGSDLEDGEFDTSSICYIQGYVTTIQYYPSAQYPTYTFWIADEKGSGNKSKDSTVQIYSGVLSDATKTDTIEVNDFIKVSGYMKNYSGQAELAKDKTSGSVAAVDPDIYGVTTGESTVSVETSQNGSLNLIPGLYTNHTSVADFQAVPDDGYEIEWVKVNGKEITPDGEGNYTFEVKGDMKVTSQFKEKGSITPTKYSYTWAANSGTFVKAKEHLQVTATGFTMDQKKNTSNTDVKNTYAQMRVYVGHELTISVPATEKIVKVEFLDKKGAATTDSLGCKTAGAVVAVDAEFNVSVKIAAGSQTCVFVPTAQFQIVDIAVYTLPVE